MISVCIATIRNGPVQHFIASLDKQTFKDWELVVVTQGNDKDLFEALNAAALNDNRIRVIHVPKYGKCCALNVAVHEAKGDILAFTDDDCIANPDWLEVIAKCFEERSDVGVVAGDLVPSERKGFRISTCPATHVIECVYDPTKHGYKGPPGFYWAGGNWAMRRSVYDLVGPFDEYLGSGSEFKSAMDIDYVVRIEALGIIQWTTPRSIILHAYGRRYGLSSVLHIYRVYGYGNGALVAKLHVWGHRLANEWGHKRTFMENLRLCFSRPQHVVRDLYKRKFFDAGYRDYLAKYTIDERRVTVPKENVN